MASFVLFSDSSCDLPADIAAAHQVETVPLYVTVDGQTYHQYLDNSEISLEQVYTRQRAKASVTTVAANAYDFVQAMEPFLKAGQDILYIGLSSALSSTFQAATTAAAELSEKYPDRTIRTVDSLNGSMGLGLLLLMTDEQRRSGASLEQAAAFALENRLRLIQWFTADTLYYLRRGGRVSATAAAVGTLLHIKPIFHVNDAGMLESVEKARGRAGSLRVLADRILEQGDQMDRWPVFVAHSDCQEDAEKLAAMLRAGGVREVHVVPFGPVIGSHSGPGTLSVNAFGKKRTL